MGFSLAKQVQNNRVSTNCKVRNNKLMPKHEIEKTANFEVAPS